MQGGSGAQIGELIHRQLETFIPAADRFECDGPIVDISPDATQAIGLALHELATNAVKHGAWSVAGGRVKVSWKSVIKRSTNNMLRIKWFERDGPAVAAPTRKGFGHVVIEKMAAQRVKGAPELLFEPEGLSWTLTDADTHIIAADEPGLRWGTAGLMPNKLNRVEA